ncbi:unnamed protein product [Allacma fusca]|uniref:Uncharacterized protein n=1 Tax=Allacma fusca TaxID=39272 RepID=A0A8J2K3M4_9HEXA|nr:unnamed protein product [Allacma fusca]
MAQVEVDQHYLDEHNAKSKKRSAPLNCNLAGLTKKGESTKRPTTFRTIPLALEIKKQTDGDSKVAPRIFLDNRWIIYMGGESGNQSEKGFLNLRHWKDKSAGVIGDSIALPEEHIPGLLLALSEYIENSSRESLPPKDIRVGEIHNAVLHSKSNANSTNGSNSQSGSVSYASTATVRSGHSRPPTPSFLQPEGEIVYGSISTTRGTRDVSKQFNNNYSSSSSNPNGTITMNSANDTFRLLKCFYRDVQFQGETRTFFYVRRLGRMVNFDIRRTLWLIERLVYYYMQSNQDHDELMKCLHRCVEICLCQNETSMSDGDGDGDDNEDGVVVNHDDDRVGGTHVNESMNV